MQNRRVVPLLDSHAAPPSWNERMVAGEFAVLFANRQPLSVDPQLGPVAVIFPSLAEAKAYASEETMREPYLRCSIYTHEGMAAPPVEVIAGSKGQDKSFLSSGFRLWVGSGCLAVGAVLGVAELASGMRLSWAGMLGARVGPVGAILLLTEVGVRLSARQSERRKQNAP